VGGKMKFACVDGPEFDGYQVDFDELMNRNGTYRGQEAEMTQSHMCRFDKLGQKLIP
jgi:ferredoxin--NADP+ reductase